MTPHRRVLLLSMEWTPAVSGGVGTYVYELGHGLRQHGYDVTVLAYTAGQAKVIEEERLTVHLVPPSQRSLSQSAKVSLVEGIQAFNADLIDHGKSVVDAFRPEIVHFHQWHTRRAAVALAKYANTPVIGTAHHLSEPAERWWGQEPDPEIVEEERALFQGDMPVIVVSHSMKHLVCETFPISSDHVHVIHCALDSAPFRGCAHDSEALARLRSTVAQPDDVVILYTGRIHPQKGIEAIYEAGAKVIERSSRPVRYLLAGGTDSRTSTRMIETLQARFSKHVDRFILLGKLPRTQLPLLHRISDFAIVPSVYEPFGFTALETMASGTPVIVSDDGGLAEIVEHERSGLKVPVESIANGRRSIEIEAFAQAQLRFIENDALRLACGEQAAERANAAFSIRGMVDANAEVYRSLGVAARSVVPTVVTPIVRSTARAGVMASSSSSWIARPLERRGARHRVVLLPHAGGGSSMFRPWTGHFPRDVEPVIVRLPGRESRMHEPLCRRLLDAAHGIADAVAELDGPFSFFGHSMGALLGFEVARILHRTGRSTPRNLIVASYCAPMTQNAASIQRHESEEDIVERITAGGDMQREMAAELFATLRPIFLADIEMCESYRYTEGLPLPCPIYAHRGARDYVSDEDMQGWERETERSFRLRTWSGDHFFVSHHIASLVEDIVHTVGGATATHETSGAQRSSVI